MGRVAARYYVDYETCEAFAKKLPPGASDTVVLQRFGEAVEFEQFAPGLKDPVADRPNHSDLCTLEFRQDFVRIQKKFKLPQRF